jgi:L-lactate dehydrogenase complex protein LldG
MTQSATFDISSTTSKENMRKKIRHALTQKSTTKFPYINIHADPLEKPDNILAMFTLNFRNAGGKLIACDKTNFVDILHKIIVGQGYSTILNTNQSIAPALEKRNLHYITSMDSRQEVDAAIFYSDILIARTGSMLFTPKYSMYTSIKNISKNIIVIAFTKNLVLDLKDAFTLQQEKNQGVSYDFVEIITPSKPVNENGEENFSPLEPRFILMLIKE